MVGMHGIQMGMMMMLRCRDGENDEDNYGNCDSAMAPQGVAYDLILKFVESEEFWLEK